MSKEASEIIQAVFPLSPKIGDVLIYSQLPLKDKYGNVKDDTAVVYAIGRPLYEKINWSTISYRDLPALLKSEFSTDTRNNYTEMIKF